MKETWVRSLGQENPPEKEMAAHSSVLAWRIPWTEEPGGLQSTGSQRVGHDWVDSTQVSTGVSGGRSGSTTVALRPAASASPWNLWDVLISGPISDLLNETLWGWDPVISVLTGPPAWFWCTLGFVLHAQLFQSCPTLCNPMDCSLPSSPVHGVLQARILEWVAISFSKGSSSPKEWTPSLASPVLVQGSSPLALLGKPTFV